MQARQGVVVDGGKTDTVPGGVLECIGESMHRQRLPGGAIDIGGPRAGMDCRKHRSPSGQDGIEHPALERCGWSEAEGARHVGPVSVDVRIAMEHRQFAGGKLAIGRNGE